MNVATLGLQTLLRAQNSGFCLKAYLRQESVPQLPLDTPTETPRSPETVVTTTQSPNLPPPCETHSLQGRRERGDTDPSSSLPLLLLTWPSAIP